MNWFLEDGQALSHIPDWQQCLTEERGRGLSVLSASVRALQADREMREADALSDAWQADMTLMVALGNELVHGLPQPNGFFIGNRERAEAHAAVCRFYTLASGPFERLGQLGAQMHALWERTRESTLHEDGALRNLTLAKHAADRIGEEALRASIIGLAEELYRIREGNASLRRRLENASAAWLDFCTERFPAITVRIGDCADLEHEGTACNPRAISTLCAELLSLLREHAKQY